MPLLKKIVKYLPETEEPLDTEMREKGVITWEEFIEEGKVREGEGGREEGRKGGRKGGREGGREGGRKRKGEGGRETQRGEREREGGERGREGEKGVIT